MKADDTDICDENCLGADAPKESSPLGLEDVELGNDWSAVY